MPTRHNRTFSTGEAAKRMGVGRETVRRWCQTRRLAALKTLGGHWRVTSAALDAAIARAQPQA